LSLQGLPGPKVIPTWSARSPSRPNMVFLGPLVFPYMVCQVSTLSCHDLPGPYLVLSWSAWFLHCPHMVCLDPTMSLYGEHCSQVVPTWSTWTSRFSLHGLPGLHVVPSWSAWTPGCPHMVSLGFPISSKKIILRKTERTTVPSEFRMFRETSLVANIPFLVLMRHNHERSINEFQHLNNILFDTQHVYITKFCLVFPCTNYFFIRPIK